MAIICGDELQTLFLNNIPLIDVRAPVEFAAGAFPHAANLPILNDAERHQIGICYRNKGPDAATALGHDLVSGALREQRIAAWYDFALAHPDAAIYCFRGGQRSTIAAQWLKQAGVDLPRVEGGYKALRRLLLTQMTSLPPLIIVSGKTGSGKTRFLAQFPRKVDLEHHANHRGSAFGKTLTEQPAQINFENAVAIEFLHLARDDETGTPVLIEDESRLIGRVHLPPELQVKMKMSPVLVIEDTLESRARHIFEEYIVENWQLHQSRFNDHAPFRFSEYLLTAIDAIKKRLGAASHAEIRQIMVAVLERQTQTGDLTGHLAWIELLLERYYDPMYLFQLKKKADRILFRGSADTVANWYSHYLSEHFQ